MPHGGRHERIRTVYDMGKEADNASVVGNQTQAMEEAIANVSGTSFVGGGDRGLQKINAELAVDDYAAKRAGGYAGYEKQLPLNPAAIATLPTPFQRYETKADPNKMVYNSLTGGAAPSAANQFAVPKDLTETLEKLYAGLEQTAQDELGTLETQDFSGDIQDLIEQGKLSAEQLNELQMEGLVDAEGRALDKIGVVEADLMAKLQQQEGDRVAIQQALQDESAMRRGEFVSSATDRIEQARRALGPNVSSEFEEVAGLTGALTEAQAASDAASASRLRQVAAMAAAERMAAPAQLAAEAKMAVGDERFRMENQLRVQLAQNIAQLDTGEREMLLQEAMRQENFGIQRDQALANAMFQIAQQKNQAVLQELIRLDTVQQRQAEILQQQGFQRDMARESRAAAGAARAQSEAEQQAQKEARDKFLFERIANAPDGPFSGISQEEFDQLPESYKQAQYEALAGSDIERTFGEPPEQGPSPQEQRISGYGTSRFGQVKADVDRAITNWVADNVLNGDTDSDYETILANMSGLKEQWVYKPNEDRTDTGKITEPEFNSILSRIVSTLPTGG